MIAHQSSDIWLTPLDIVDALGPFDLDPCGQKRWNTAKVIYTTNGLEREWFGKVWLNPPYSNVGPWLDRLINHGRGIALVFAKTETRWAQRAFREASSVFFPRGRIKFHDRYGQIRENAPSPSMFLAFGSKPKWKMAGYEF